MRVDFTVQALMTAFPDMFPSRIAALHTCFCLGGSGFDWVRGELVSYDCRHPRKVSLAARCRASSPDDLAWIYPLHESSWLVAIPDDVTQDWLDAAEEMARFVLAKPAKEGRDPRDRLGICVCGQNPANHGHAHTALARIAAIRAARTV